MNIWKKNMSNALFLWINHHQLIDENNGEKKYLFDDCGINLSSKYDVQSKWNEEEKLLSVSINLSDANVLFEKNFYSKNITDLKVIVGKNGVGKSSILRILTEIASGNLLESETKSLQYCLLWLLDNSTIQYSTNLSLIPRFEVPINMRIETGSLLGDVFSYSAVFNDEMIYGYPSGSYSHIHNLSTGYLIQQDVENFNNNIDMYGNKDRLFCHSIMDSIRQINFVSTFLKKGVFFDDIFHLPNGVTFSFSIGHIRNAIHSLLENVINVSEDSNSSKKIENIWLDYYNNIKNLKLKIYFSLVLSEYRKYHRRPDQNDDITVEIDEFPDDGKCLKLSDIILNKYKLSLSYEDVDNFYNSLCCAKNIANRYFYFDPINQNDEITQLLKNISNYKSHTPIMEMFWNHLLSSGESSYLRLFSRLYDEILQIKRYHNKDSIEALFLIDEVDLYLHPEWQRGWFFKFIEGLNLMQREIGVALKFHLILTTHSPFMLTEFFDQNVVKLERENGNKSCKVFSDKKNCFLAGNIYDILGNGFVQNGSIGKFVEHKLKNLLEKIGEKNYNLDDSDKFLFNNIGDSLMKAMFSQRLKDRL